jgi:hypothetical protein
MVKPRPGQLMPSLRVILDDWESQRFAQALKHELEELQPGTLPLERATTQGGHVEGNSVSVTVLSVHERGPRIVARVGVFFEEVVGGCSCGDDPVSSTAYCEIEVSIAKGNGEARFRLVPG